MECTTGWRSMSPSDQFRKGEPAPQNNRYGSAGDNHRSPSSSSNYGLCVNTSTHLPSVLFPDIAMHRVANFQVKNNGSIDIFVNLEEPVPPGETSPPFSSSGTYIIRSTLENSPLPPREIVVTFSPAETFEAKAINGPNLNVDFIVKFDFKKGDLISSLNPV
ncbi:uncharacterized protein LACBIDRAFT_325233 [Laccaria bicolor S238N-H82]|uniref:Predicted protein n=1 Tax=Laccaria bicolor (strain S238N-H82 / ATCC MYA-4686) TaxID=486041 RepID=B0D497_LACBS|nr:uncharacterized protein LACBIDRAFT_325233 [Laccaria bicolor S238N-H82]EDR10537.1 predicted protein [Laccaria bicolor S238N-H82]|eukprot:XP_001878987.1 predicted protein [Laccaria bicolor S238N-H82]